MAGRSTGLAVLGATLLSCAAAGAAAPAAPALTSVSTHGEFDRFAPLPNPTDIRLDYSIWDEALQFFVFRMGRSIREGAPSPEAGIGTRRIYGHDSLYRLEGNRVAFSYLETNVIESLTAYREDLEATADTVEIARLDRNEQLAYWINLHNVSVIEQIALAYPVSQPSRIMIEGRPLDEAPFITVNGVAMSPRDIRTKIVYRHWSDPKVIYGFFRGEIGGPSIMDEAFTGRNVADMLDRSASEFVNSLRGTQRAGDTLRVSRIYDEARPFLFPAWPADLKGHLGKYSEGEVTEILAETDEVEATIYEGDVSDLAKGERDPNYGYIVAGSGDFAGSPQGTRIPSAIQRLLRERQQKIIKQIRRGELVGRVTVIDLEGTDLSSEPEEVE